MSDENSETKLIEMQPERVDFACPDCGLNCLLWPRSMPPAVQHVLPVCKAWTSTGTEKQVESGEKAELVYDFLRRAKLPVLGGGKY